MHEGRQFSRVESVLRKPFSGTVYNLEVEDDHSYVVGETAVHNCGWGEWAWKRQTLTGRLCSHGFATLMQAQAQNMIGAGGVLWQHQYTAAVKEGSMAGEECYGCGEERYEMVAEPVTGKKVCTGCMERFANEAAARTKLGMASEFEVEFLTQNMDAESLERVLASINTRFVDKSKRLALVVYPDGGSEVIKVPHVAKPVALPEPEPVIEEPHVAAVEYEHNDLGADDPELMELQAMIAENNPEFAGFKKEATRHFSFGEQDELQNESMGSLARNIDLIRTDGAHFDDMTRYEDDDDVDLSGLFL
jgi:hypothetical protein